MGKRAPVSSGSFLLWRAAHQASWFCLICPISVRRNLLALFRGLEHCRQAMSICHAPRKVFPIRAAPEETQEFGGKQKAPRGGRAAPLRGVILFSEKGADTVRAGAGNHRLLPSTYLCAAFTEGVTAFSPAAISQSGQRAGLAFDTLQCRAHPHIHSQSRAAILSQCAFQAAE